MKDERVALLRRKQNLESASFGNARLSKCPLSSCRGQMTMHGGPILSDQRFKCGTPDDMADKSTCLTFARLDKMRDQLDINQKLSVGQLLFLSS